MSYPDDDLFLNTRVSIHKGPGPGIMGAATLIGHSVHNGLTEHLGVIKEIMINMETGKIAYAVLSQGGLFTIGEKLFAVPWQSLHLDPFRHQFILNIDKQRFTAAPGFEKNDWPAGADPIWVENIPHFYQISHE